MTTVNFYGHDGVYTGFLITGHSTASAEDDNGKLVCAAISSAAYMTANTLTEIIKAEVTADVRDGYMCVKLFSKLSDAQPIINGLALHTKELAKQYRKYLKVYSEV